MSDARLLMHELVHHLGFHAQIWNTTPDYSAEENQFAVILIDDDEKGLAVGGNGQITITTCVSWEDLTDNNCLSDSDRAEYQQIAASDADPDRFAVAYGHWLARYLIEHDIPARIAGDLTDEPGTYCLPVKALHDALAQPFQHILICHARGMPAPEMEKLIAQSPPVTDLPVLEHHGPYNPYLANAKLLAEAVEKGDVDPELLRRPETGVVQ